MAKKEFTYEAIMTDIKARRFSPVYILMGEEPYFMDQITNSLLETVVGEAERDFNQVVLYGADTDAAGIINAAKRFPMMSEYQLIVVREAQVIRDIEKLAAYVKNPLSSTVLVVNHKYKTLDGRKMLAATAEKTGVLFNSQKVPDYKMPGFITGLLQEKKMEIDQKATQMLSDYIGNDLGRLVKELDKLAIILSDRGSNRVTPELIEQNIGISKEYNSFELTKALAVKDVLKANRIIQYFEKNPKNNPIQMTLPILFNYFSNLFICFYSKDRSDNGLMAALGMRSTFMVKDYSFGLKNYSAMQVFRIIGAIRETDARSKGVGNSSVPDAELLRELIYRILH